MFGGEKITPDEIDAYTVVNISNPGVGLAFAGTSPVSGTSDVKALVLVNAIPNWPRNVQFQIQTAGTSVAVTGTLVLNGKDQFGSVITETLALLSGTGAGTIVGTKVFGQFTSGTVTYGTFSTSGTPAVGLVAGTNCLLGLPVKIGGTTDVVLLAHNAGTGPVTVGGGTIAAFVNAPMHAVRPAAILTGTEVVVAWVNSTYNPTNIPVVANLNQRT